MGDGEGWGMRHTALGLGLVMGVKGWEERSKGFGARAQRGTCRSRQAHSSRGSGHSGSCSHRLQEMDVGGVSPGPGWAP